VESGQANDAKMGVLQNKTQPDIDINDNSVITGQVIPIQQHDEIRSKHNC